MIVVELNLHIINYQIVNLNNFDKSFNSMFDTYNIKISLITDLNFSTYYVASDHSSDFSNHIDKGLFWNLRLQSQEFIPVSIKPNLTKNILSYFFHDRRFLRTGCY